MRLLEQLQGVLAELAAYGWRQRLLELHRLDICADDLVSELARELHTINRDRDTGFDDFSKAGCRAIEPGDPARSLLYHALASPAVPLPSNHDNAGPTWQQLDVVENFIYSLARLAPRALSGARLGVFAYQYRPKDGTPHQEHADMVFSRTGLARVGTEEPIYDPKRRSFQAATNVPGKIGVLPARYGVFYARPESGASATMSTLGLQEKHDRERTFWLPFHKVFSGKECVIDCDLDLEWLERHRAEKLRRIVVQGGVQVAPGFDIDKAPFVRQSSDKELVLLQPQGASAIVRPPKQPITRVAMQYNSSSKKDEIVRFGVARAQRPLRWLGIDLSLNRHYTSMMIVSSRARALLEQLLLRLGRNPMVRGRNAPEFVNIRHRVVNGKLQDLNELNEDQFRAHLEEGNYEAAMFEDGACHGCVTAVVRGGPEGEGTLPAFSIIAAPTFFPRADELDLEKFVTSHRNQFREGGAFALCEGRQRIDPGVTTPDDKRAFSSDEDTVVAVVADGRGKSHDGKPRRVSPTSYLTDGASNTFGPGWDITIGRDNDGIFYTTFGLGSPFPEDIKLCAAANGYWPAASPDSARAYHRLDTPTAVPLLDEELGYHPEHPLVLAGVKEASLGWDGEHGPFFQNRDQRPGVNYLDIDRVDYVSNVLKQKFALRLFDRLNSDVLINRMGCLRACIQATTKGRDDVNRTRKWLVEAEMQSDGDYQFVFAEATREKPQRIAPNRMWQSISAIRFHCKDVTPTSLRWSTDGRTWHHFGSSPSAKPAVGQ